MQSSWWERKCSNKSGILNNSPKSPAFRKDIVPNWIANNAMITLFMMQMYGKPPPLVRGIQLFQKSIILAIHQHLLTEAIHVGYLDIHYLTLFIFLWHQYRIHESIVGRDV